MSLRHPVRGVAVCFSALLQREKCVAVSCSALQCVAACYCVLQCVAVVQRAGKYSQEVSFPLKLYCKLSSEAAM